MFASWEVVANVSESEHVAKKNLQIQFFGSDWTKAQKAWLLLFEDGVVLAGVG
jgi:hypothetical protein